MEPLTRRDFLVRAARTGAVTVAALAGGRLTMEEALAAWSRAPGETFAGGELLGTLPFVSEGNRAVGEVVGSGLTGRLAYDLSRLDPEEPVVPAEDFYIRTLPPVHLPPGEGWTVRITGRVQAEGGWTATELRRRSRSQGEVLLECSGNNVGRRFGLLSAARWRGVPLAELFEEIPILEGTRRVEIAGFDRHEPPYGGSKPGGSWIFSLDQLARGGAFLATAMNGEPLTPAHGHPVRLVVPNWYGCCLAKWVTEIRFVDDSAPATSQMREFAGRTHQEGTPELARDYRPAKIELAAMPVRVEKWRLPEGGVSHRVLGIVWGGEQPVEELEIRFGADRPYEPVARVDRRNLVTWGFWEHPWSPPGPGRYPIRLSPAESGIPAQRLAMGYYDRTVEVDPG